MELETNLALDDTLGVTLASVIVSASLFGVLTTQCHYYLLRFKHDPGWLKCVVVSLWIIDAMHQVSASIIIFQYSVRHYGDPTYLPQSSWPVSLCITLEPLPAFIVQMYFTRRFYHLNPKLWPMAAFTVGLSVIAFATGEACAVITYTLDYFSEYQRFTWLVTTWLVTCSICDITITIPVAWTLHSSRTGFKETDILLTKLIIWTVNTSALPASFALLEAITFITKNHTLIHLASNIVLAKLYSNALLASLNRRGALTKDEVHSVRFSDNIAMPRMISRRNQNHEMPSNGWPPSLLPFARRLPGSNNDAYNKIRVSVSTHHYYESQPRDSEEDQKPFGDVIVIDHAGRA